MSRNISSNIDYNSINPNFPVAGQNNDSQGFRDNFANIKLGLATASAEITDLQIHTAQLTEDNDFSFDGTLKRVKIQNSGFATNVDITGSSVLDFSQASYHHSTIGSSTTFGVANWPSANLAGNLYTQIRVAVQPSSSSQMQISFRTINGGTLRPETGTSLPYTSASTDLLMWDLWTIDNGTTVFVKFVGRFPDPNATPGTPIES